MPKISISDYLCLISVDSDDLMRSPPRTATSAFKLNEKLITQGGAKYAVAVSGKYKNKVDELLDSEKLS